MHLFLVRHPGLYIKQIRQKQNTMAQTKGIFERHMRSMGLTDLKDKVVCELGPGDSLYHGVLAWLSGAKQMYMLDIEDLAGSEAKFDVSNIKTDRLMPVCKKGETWKSYLKKLNVNYLTDGIRSYYEVPDDTVDVLFSHTVLQHIRLDIFDETIKQMNRMCKTGCICSHKVDFRDMLGGGMNDLKIPTEKWESDLYRQMPNYVNRILYYDMIHIFEANGFELVGEPELTFRTDVIDKDKLIPEYRNKDDRELKITGAGFVCRKVG